MIHPEIPLPSLSRSLRTVGIATLVVVAAAPAAFAQDDRERPAGKPLTGKYGCAESVYTSDGYRSEQRGFVTLLPKNRYRQGKGAVGKVRYNAATGVTTFKGGGLDGSTATGIDGKRTRLLITVDLGDDEARWACTHVKKG